MENIRQYNEKQRFHDKAGETDAIHHKATEHFGTRRNFVAQFLPKLGLAATPAEIYRKAVPAVVLLVSMEPSSRSKGTGSMITNRYVLTNAHVVLGDNGRPLDKTLVFYSFENPNDGIEQNFRKGRQAKVSHYSEKLDLALLEVEDPPKVSPLGLGPADGVQIGDPVLAIGHPENGGLWSLTSGRIGAKFGTRKESGAIISSRLRASLNRGNSGGPLRNEDGQRIGVNTSIARKASDGLAITGINFAVQSDVAREWLQSVGLRLQGHGSGCEADQLRHQLQKSPSHQPRRRSQLPQLRQNRLSRPLPQRDSSSGRGLYTKKPNQLLSLYPSNDQSPAPVPR